MKGAPLRDRATRASTEPASRLGLSAGIPSAGSYAFALAQLRHAYTHLMAERVGDQRQFAEGLIAPAIRIFEREQK